MKKVPSLPVATALTPEQTTALLNKMNAIRLNYFPTSKTVPGEIVRVGTTILVKVVNTIYIAPRNPGSTSRWATISHFRSGTTTLNEVLSCLVKLKACTQKEASDYKKFRADNDHYESVRSRVADVEDALKELKVHMPVELHEQLRKLEEEADKILDLID